MLSIKKLTSLFMGAVLLGGGAVIYSNTVGATPASAVNYTATHATGITFPGGPGHSGTVWAGTWNNGKRGFCLDFGKSTPNRSGMSLLTGNVPGMDTEESKRAKLIANKYDNNGSPEAAGNAQLAVWRLQHDAAFTTWYGSARAKGVISAARHNAVEAILADAAQHAPYKVTVVTNKVQVGQTGSGTVTVLGSNGRPADGRMFNLTSISGRILTVNGVATNKGITRPTGGVFTYQRNTTGKITFTGQLTTDSSATGEISLSSAGHQRTLSGGYGDTAFASYAYDLSPNGPSITSACDTDCNGMSTVTFRFSNPAGTQAIKWTEKVGTVVVATLSARPRTTGTAVARIADGKVITSSSYCYTGSVLGGPCTTPTEVVKASYEIVCPPWAQGKLKLPCNCRPDQTGSVTLSSPADSARFYRGFVSINQGAASSFDLVNGNPATIATSKLAAGTNVVVSFTVYRDAARTIPLASHVLQNLTVN